MKNYNLRELYSPTMSGLSAKMYQFDCISRDLFPKLMQHFEDIGVESSMYVSQW